MEDMTFYRTEFRRSQRIRFFGVVVLGVILAVAITLEKWVSVGLASLWFVVYAWRRTRYGPAAEPPLILVSRDDVVFDDCVWMGRSVWKLNNVESIRVVGPARDRRIQVQTKAGERREVVRALGRRTANAVVFLRKSLPATVTITEDEPPSWSSAIRGDF